MPVGLFKAFLIVGAAFWIMGAQGVGIIFGACLMGWLLDMDSF